MSTPANARNASRPVPTRWKEPRGLLGRRGGLELRPGVDGARERNRGDRAPVADQHDGNLLVTGGEAVRLGAGGVVRPGTISLRRRGPGRIVDRVDLPHRGAVDEDEPVEHGAGLPEHPHDPVRVLVVVEPRVALEAVRSDKGSSRAQTGLREPPATPSPPPSIVPRDALRRAAPHSGPRTRGSCRRCEIRDRRRRGRGGSRSRPSDGARCRGARIKGRFRSGRRCGTRRRGRAEGRFPWPRRRGRCRARRARGGPPARAETGAARPPSRSRA